MLTKSFPKELNRSNNPIIKGTVHVVAAEANRDQFWIYVNWRYITWHFISWKLTEGLNLKSCKQRGLVTCYFRVSIH